MIASTLPGTRGSVFALLVALLLPGEQALAAGACGDADTACMQAAIKTHTVRARASWETAFVRPLADRMGAASADLIDYVSLDNRINGYPERPRATTMDPELMRDAKAAFAGIPPAIRNLFETRLAGIYFLENLGSTGYTEYIDNHAGAHVAAFIVLDAGVLKKSKPPCNSWPANCCRTLQTDQGTRMNKTILLTGATDGIGLATARMLAPQGHTLLLHGRNAAKLADVQAALAALPGAGSVETFVADLSRLAEVASLAQAVQARHARLDVLINNAGVFRVPETRTPDGLDARFAVNTIAPYLLTQKLLPLLTGGRVINLSSAAQAPVNLEALAGRVGLDDMEAYAQSKLALTMWSRHMALPLGDQGPVIVAVNPGSMLGSKMVKEAFGVAGGDLGIGADILTRAALAEEFATASGQYFDNDAKRFGPPHPDALDPVKSAALVRVMEALLHLA